MLRHRLRLAGLTAIAGTLLWTHMAVAEPITRASIEAWLTAPPPANMPAAGTQVSGADIENLRSLLPPGYFEFIADGEVPVEIQDTGDYSPSEDYRNVTAANAGKATLAADGTMQGYVAGQPFSDAQIVAAKPEEAGYMVAWNNVHRWQYYGYMVDAMDMIYVDPTAPGVQGTRAPGMEGGGNVQRSMVQTYHRVYLNGLAMLPAQGFRVKAADADKRLFKDYISFSAPFDVKGTTFVVERSLDPNEEDQVSSYLPKERRVRRLSAQERADKFMGSNWTLDDFEAFSGRVMDYEWVYRGKKAILHVTDSREPKLRFGGKQSNVFNDRWQVRNCYVVELKPRWAEHPVAAKYLLVDEQTSNGLMAMAINRKDELWRVFMPAYQKAPADNSTPALANETSVLRWRGAIGLDVLDSSTSLAIATTPTAIPTMTDKQIERKFSISNLSGGR